MTTVNNTVDNTPDKPTDKRGDKATNSTTNSTDYNKLKQKPNENILSKVSHGDFDFISNEFLETFILWLEYKKDRREKLQIGKVA